MLESIRVDGLANSEVRSHRFAIVFGHHGRRGKNCPSTTPDTQYLIASCSEAARLVAVVPKCEGCGGFFDITTVFKADILRHP